MKAVLGKQARTRKNSALADVRMSGGKEEKGTMIQKFTVPIKRARLTGGVIEKD